MGKLYIFGNGLDLHYKLKTKPSDFVNILKDKDIYNETNNAAEIFENYNVLWSNFEQDMAYIELEQIEENQVQSPDYMSEHEYDRDGVITNVEEYVDSLKGAIFESLSDMIYTAEQDIAELSNDDEWLFEDGDMILSFNYTSTIESISNALDVPILHIHGFYNAEESLILGYREPLNNYNYLKYSNSEDGDYYMERQLHLINDFYNSLKKDMQTEELRNFLTKAGKIDEILVYGHSLGDVDVPYLELVDNILQPTTWKVSYHDDNDDVFSNSESLSFRDKISFFKW